MWDLNEERERGFINYRANRIYYGNRQLDLRDLKQEGWLIVLEATANFDPDRGDWPAFVSTVLDRRMSRYARKALSPVSVPHKAMDIPEFSEFDDHSHLKSPEHLAAHAQVREGVRQILERELGENRSLITEVLAGMTTVGKTTNDLTERNRLNKVVSRAKVRLRKLHLMKDLFEQIKWYKIED